MKSYVDRQASALLRKLAARMRAAERDGTADAIHDLRTSIRRLSECLRTFDIFFPDGQAGRLRGELREIMHLAGDVRNRDIAGELLTKGGMPSDGKILVKLGKARRAAELTLAQELKALGQDDFAKRYRRELKL
ncbi:MAG: hypothetical protein JWO80_1993 [Bryobacterales bacterium]|nr:hypothetical protein [Bryobacterales bacterium]